MGRRSALRLLGLAAGALVPLPIVSAGFRALMQKPGPVVEDGHSRADAPVAGRRRRWMMIIDLRRCDGCPSVNLPPQFTQACIEGHFAPRPMEWIEVYEVPHRLTGHESTTYFLPAPCMHCQNPPCTNVCPVGATFSTPEGVVLIDQDRCIGCRICMAACPYDRRFFNWGEPPTPPEASLADYSPEHQVSAQKGTVMKCDFCPDMARVGRLPYCVQGCPNDAIYYGDLEEDLATNGRTTVGVHRFLADNDAYRLKEEAGTEPRVFYIPGHGQAVNRRPRDPSTMGRLPTEWRWQARAEAVSWNR